MKPVEGYRICGVDTGLGLRSDAVQLEASSSMKPVEGYRICGATPHGRRVVSRNYGGGTPCDPHEYLHTSGEGYKDKGYIGIGMLCSSRPTPC